MLSTPQSIGQPLARVDGRLKVTGQARYTAEWNVPNLIYGAVVESAIARGQVQGIDVTPALAARGVVAVMTQYHIPSCADTPEISVEWLDIPDPHINELGARGFGEIGQVGTAAITNAVFHATGKRWRKLPLTPDKLIA